MAKFKERKLRAPRRDGSPYGDRTRCIEAARLLADGVEMKDLAVRYKVSYAQVRNIVAQGELIISYAERISRLRQACPNVLLDECIADRSVFFGPPVWVIRAAWAYAEVQRG